MASFDDWIAALEQRHLADLTFPEVSRALRALSSTYVERRRRLAAGAALSGAGKRAAFALFYGPLHFLLVREIARALDAGKKGSHFVDIGCGTGAAGAGWASAAGLAAGACSVYGIDRHPWALQEAAWTYRYFGLRARTSMGDAADARLPREPAVCLVAFVLNELSQAARDKLLGTLMDRRRSGSSVLIVEPLARGVAPWWDSFRRQVEPAGGQADEWRFHLERPPLVARLDRAAGLDHRELTGRSLWLP